MKTLSSIPICMLLLSLLLSACAGVSPWERDLLAQEKMQLDPNPIDSSYDDHIYFSKESSSGGAGVGGGGCGCN